MSVPSPLRARLGYDFDDQDLARAALTHRSADSRHNERLEFLGDALLDLVISDELYNRASEASEGDLSRLRASLVKRDSLADVAAGIDLGRYLKLGAGELRNGGAARRSILADTLEALLGAVYLDGGYDAARECVLRLFSQRLDNLPDPATLRDPKTRLQELLQSRGLARPTYELVGTDGEAHERKFTVCCVVETLQLSATGIGSSRRRAEQRAAAGVLQLIAGGDGDGDGDVDGDEDRT